MITSDINLFISYLTSSELNFTQGFYDLEIATGSAEQARVTRVLEGIIQLSQQITTGSY